MWNGVKTVSFIKLIDFIYGRKLHQLFTIKSVWYIFVCRLIQRKPLRAFWIDYKRFNNFSNCSTLSGLSIAKVIGVTITGIIIPSVLRRCRLTDFGPTPHLIKDFIFLSFSETYADLKRINQVRLALEPFLFSSCFNCFIKIQNHFVLFRIILVSYLKIIHIKLLITWHTWSCFFKKK